MRYAILLAVLWGGLASAAPIHVPSRSVLIPDDLYVPVRNLGVVHYHLMKVLQVPQGEIFFIPTGTARQEWLDYAEYRKGTAEKRAEIIRRQEQETMSRVRLYCDNRGYLRAEHFERAMAEHQLDVARMVKQIYEFGYAMDKDSPIFNHNVPEGINRDLAGIMRLDSGRSAFAIINPVYPDLVHATISTAHADKDGKVPLESRLKIDGKPYSLPPVTDEYYEDTSRRPYVYWRNPTRAFPLAEAVFNAYPIVVRKNLRVEIKLYARHPEDPTPWATLLARQILAHNITRRTNEIVPDKYFPTDKDIGHVLTLYEDGQRKIPVGDYEYEMALRDALFQVIHSQWVRMYVWPEEVVLQEVGDKARKIYSIFMGVKDRYPGTPDPDVMGSTVTVGRVKRADFDRMLAGDTMLQRGADLQGTFFQRLMVTSPFPDSDCSFMMHAMAVDFPFAGADRKHKQWFDQKMAELRRNGVYPSEP